MRSRFLRHLRAWWDVHRHRLAPEVAERLAAMQASGQLTVLAGKPQEYARAGDTVVIGWRPRESGTTAQLSATRVINCTGPQGNLERSDDPLLRRLSERGLIRRDSCRLGIDVTA